MKFQAIAGHSEAIPHIAILLLDTGASGIIVDPKVAEKGGIKRVVQTDFRGVGDKGTRMVTLGLPTQRESATWSSRAVMWT